MHLPLRAVTLLWISAWLLGAASTGRAEITYDAEVHNPHYVHGLHSPHSGAFLAYGNDGVVWRSEGGPDGTQAHTDVTATLRRMAFAADRPVAVVVGDAGTLLLTQDDGRHWSRIDVPSAAQADLRDVLFVPSTGAWIAVGTRGTLLRSEDGQQWRQVPLPGPAAPQIDLTTLALLPDGSLWAGGTQGALWRSTDQGLQWHLLQHDPQAPPVRVLLARAGQIWGLSSEGRLWRCLPADGRCTLRQTPARGFLADLVEAGPGRLFGVTHQGDLLRSFDAGDHWQAASLGQGQALSQVHAEPAGGLWIVGHRGQVLRSFDGGQRWQRSVLPHQPDLMGLDVTAGRLWAYGLHGALYTGHLDEDRWQAAAIPRPEFVAALAALPANATGQQTVFAAGPAGSMARSLGGEAGWEPVALRFKVAMYPADFMALHAAPDGRSLVAAGPTGTVMHSGDGGRHWTTALHTPYAQGEVFPAVVADPDRGVLLTLEMRGTVYRSGDGGRRWQRVSAPKGLPPDALWRCGVVAGRSGSIVLAGKGSQLLRSTDGGRRWHTVRLAQPHNLFAALAEPDSDTLWLAGEGGAVLRSDDGGAHWRAVTVQPLQAGAPVHSVLLKFLAPAAGGERVWLLVGRDGTVLRSSDGELWQQQDSGSRADLRAALREPGSGAAVLVGSHGTVLRSHDAGRHWQTLFSHTEAHLKTALFLNDGSLVAAGERLLRLRPVRSSSGQ